MPIRVHIKNFQSIKDSGIEVEGFTVVTGSNNRGKSALMRAIHGVFTNTKGTSFVRRGTDYSSVELEFDSGEKVRWEKGPKIKPRYILNDGEPIHSGRDVPPEVAALDIRPVMAGGREVWPQVARQIVDVAFLVDQPGSVVAEAISDVERVGVLNRALKGSESDRRAAANLLKVRRQDEGSLVAEMGVYVGLDDVVVQAESIVDAIEQTEHLREVIGKVSSIRDRWIASNEEVERLSGVDSIEVPRWDLQGTLTEIQALQDLRNRLSTSRQEVEGLAGIRDSDVPEFNGDLTSVQKMVDILEALQSLQSRRNDVRGQISEINEALSEKEGASKEAFETVQSLIGDHGECPVCGTVF